jgi:DNA replication and repair protein RecF
MRLERLVLRHFRNYSDAVVEFAPEGAYITGANGSGKTNLLEAIYYLANHTSFRTTRREELQGWGAASCVVGAAVTDRGMQRQSDLVIRLTPRERHLWLNGKETRDIQKFMGHFAAVVFHPGTMHVIKGGPANRRHLVDRGILSLHPESMQVMQDLQRALKQRNALIRTAASGASAALAVWTERFIEAAYSVTRLRVEHVASLNATLADLVQRLGEDLGSLDIAYQPAALTKCSPAERERALAFHENDTYMRERFVAEAVRLRRAEEAVGQTLFGPQRDDFVIRYQGRESRSYASQGEQRLVAFLLVAALAINIYQQRGHRPVMLLDDIVSELDERNRMVIFDFLKTHAFQVFITDVEERQLYRNLSPLMPLRVRQVNGQAELRSGTSSGNTLHMPR